MNEDENWEVLEGLLDAPLTGNLIEAIEAIPVGDLAHTFSHMDAEHRAQLLDALGPERAASVIECLPDALVADALGRMGASTAAAIVGNLQSDEQADVIGSVSDEEAEAILAAMPLEDAEQARLLLNYDDDVAGGLMVQEFAVLHVGQSIGEALTHLRVNKDEYERHDVHYLYVVDESKRLRGVLRLRDMILCDPALTLGEVMIEEPLHVQDDASLDLLEDLFEQHQYLAIPVVDGRGRMVGLVRRLAVEESLRERESLAFQRAQGIVQGEELRSMPFTVRSRRRLAWLSINIVLNIVAASVIALYQETLSEIIALAVFLPIISDMSGCSGNQAIAVSMRELSLGLVHPSELFRVWFQEVIVGLINGLVLGGLIAGVAILWVGKPMLGAVVGGAMAINTILAVSLGGVLPLLLRRFGLDPALASGPILTTLTDVCGFLLALSFATAALPHLR